MLRAPSNTGPLVVTSILLQRLHDEIPTDHFTLGWLMHSLHKRSFGIIMLLLALVAVAPGLSIVAGLLLMIPAFQMIAGKPAPVFPRRIATHPLPADTSRPCCSDPYRCSDILSMWSIHDGTRRSRRPSAWWAPRFSC